MGTRFLVLCGLCAAALQAQSIAVVAPSAGQTLSGWHGFSFAVSVSSAPNVSLVCYTVDANPATNPGPPNVISGNLGAFLATGCWNLPPYSFPVNTFLWFNGPHQVVATAYDALGNVVATSSPVAFNIGNSWPVSCTPVLNVTTGTPITSTWSGQVTASASITGGCAGDSFLYYWYLDGVQQNYGAASISFDTTSVLNGPLNIGLMVLDSTSGLSYNQGAAEWSRTVTVSNSATAAEVRANARELFLEFGGAAGSGCDAAAGSAGSCTLTPHLINTDGSVASSPTFYYYANNSNATLSGATCTAGGTGTFCTGTSVTVTGAGIGNTQILATGVTHSGTDGASGGLLYLFNSPSYTVRPTDAGRMLYILGGTNCIVGAYMVKGVSQNGYLSLSSPTNPGGVNFNFASASTSSCTWALGPTRTIWSYTGSGVPNVAHYSACGTILTSYVATGTCASRYMASVFTSTAELTAQPYPAPYGQSLNISGFNNLETGVIQNSSAGLTGTQSVWAAAETAYLATQTNLISPWPKLRFTGTMDNWISPTDIYQFTAGTPSSWSPTGPATMIQLVTNTGLFTFVSLKDELTADGWPWPLQGPIRPGSASVQNWLNNIVASSGTCMANTYTTTPFGVYSLGSTFIISGSATTGMNSVYPALYTKTAINSTSFSFPCSGVANGTYSVSNDPGLTIQPFGFPVGS